jgi:peptidoglycan/LPS O-acetylase OafA/YrhL
LLSLQVQISLEQMKTSQRNQQLDILRAIAILLVLGRHGVVDPATAGMLSAPASLWQRFGWTGVDLFFVLSGFLIGGLLFSELSRTGGIDVRRFLIRRSFKIWPAYYVLLAFVIFVTPLPYNSFADRLTTFVPHLFHLQNYFREVPLHTWSLAVEEHFYLALPLLLYVIMRLTDRNHELRFRVIAIVTIIVVATCLGWRLVAGLPVENFGARLSPTHLRVDSLFWGVFLAALYHLKSAWFASLSSYRMLLAVAGFLLISPMMFLSIETSLFVSTWGYSLLYLGYGCLVVAAVSGGEAASSSPLRRLLAFVGASSYSIYLWHWHLAYPFKPLASVLHLSVVSPSLNWLLLMSLYVATAIIAGWFMGRLVEVPMLKFRDRVFPSKTSGPTLPTSGRPSPTEEGKSVLSDPVTSLAG